MTLSIYRTAFLLSILTAAVPAALPQTTVHGTVFDPQHAGIPGARVELTARDSSLRRVVTTDQQGKYSFPAIPSGRYLLETEAEGFDSVAAQALELSSGDKRVDLTLSVAAVRTEVVVTASGTPQTTDEVSKALTLVDSATVNLRDEWSLSDALRDVPGIRVERQGGPGALTSIRVRGLRPEDTALLVDGFRIRDVAAPQGDASGFLSDILMTDADRIEVLRGAGSSLYGTNATGGVVNIVTGEGGGRTRGSLLVEGGSLAMYRGRAQMSGAAADNRLQYSAGIAHLNVLSGIDGDDPARTSSTQGRIDYRFSPKARLYGRVFVTDTFSKLKVNPETTATIPASGIVDAVPGLTFIPSADNPDDTRSARVFSGALALNLRPSEAVGVTLSYQGLVTRRRFGDGPAGSGYQPTGTTLAWYDGDVHTAGGRADWRVGRHQSVNAGYEFESEDYGNRGLDPTIEGITSVSVTQRSHTIYAQDQVSLLDGRLQFAGSWRGQWFTLSRPALIPSTDAPYATQTFDAPPAAQTGDGSVAYLLRHSETKLRAHVGKGYRAPSLYERFGTYFSTFGYSAYGDPRLKPDRSLAMDFGVDQLFGARAKLSATYFYTWLQQVIVFDFSGAINPVVDPFGRFGGYRNTDGGITRGVELSGSVALTRRLGVTGAYTYTNSVQRTPLVENILRTFITPIHQYSASATERVSDRLTLYFSYVGSGTYLAPVYDPNSYSSRAYRFDGVNRAQAGASYRLPLGEFRAVRFTGKVDNLFNQDYYESGFRTPGTTAVGGMQYEF